jgi:hypothetical protein
MTKFVRRHRPTPALLVAVTALIAAVTWTAAAAGSTSSFTAHEAKQSQPRIVIRSAAGPTTTGPVGSIAGALASCHAGERAVGGGGEAFNGNWTMTESRPEGADGQVPTNGTVPQKWSVTFGNYNAGFSTVRATAYVICER